MEEMNEVMKESAKQHERNLEMIAEKDAQSNQLQKELLEIERRASQLATTATQEQKEAMQKLVEDRRNDIERIEASKAEDAREREHLRDNMMRQQHEQMMEMMEANRSSGCSIQ